jgi:prophage regulatory protein
MREEQDRLITIKDMCALINRDRRTLWAWVKSGKFPEPLRINGRTIGWRASSYRAWLDNAH